MGCRVGGRAGGREEVHAEVFQRLCWWATVSLYYVLSCGQERVMIFVWGGWGGHLYSPPLKIYWCSFKYSLALLRSLKKSEASAVVSPVEAVSFLSG